jgi:hypothetical protein
VPKECLHFSEISRHLPVDPSAFALLVLGFFLGVLELSSASLFGRFGGTGGICIKTGTGIMCGRYGGGRYASIPGTGLAWRGSPTMVRAGERAFSQGSLPEASLGVGGPVLGRGDSGGL